MRFKPAGKVYTFDAAELELSPEDRVVVETDRGMAIGRVAATPAEVEGVPAQPYKKIMRLAEEKDILRAEENKTLEDEARSYCIDLIREKKLDMKLLSVDAMFDRSKLLFFFAAEGRVDFRELVRDLARQFHTRIEMRQVGVRDEAKMVGGLGCCGRELCCASWMLEFAPISVRMAKSQNISLNPAKISGICGRLMCCLSFENKMYEQLSKNMPKVGKRVETPKGEGKVVRRNALEGTFVVFTEHGEVEISLEEWAKLKGIERPAATCCGGGGEGGKPCCASRGENAPEAVEAEEEEAGDAGDAGEEESASEGGEAATGGEAGKGEGAERNPRRRRRRRRKPSQSRERKADG